MHFGKMQFSAIASADFFFVGYFCAQSYLASQLKFERRIVLNLASLWLVTIFFRSLLSQKHLIFVGEKRKDMKKSILI